MSFIRKKVVIGSIIIAAALMISLLAYFYKPAKKESLTAVITKKSEELHFKTEKSFDVSDKREEVLPKEVDVSSEKEDDSKYALTPEKTGFKVLKSDLKFEQEVYISEYRLEANRSQLKLPSSIIAPEGAKWGLEFQASICGKVAFLDDKLVACTYDQGIYQIDLKSGKALKPKKLWYQPIGNLVQQGERVIIPQRNGHISSFDSNSLSKLWSSRSAVDTKPDVIDISISGISLEEPYLYVSKHWGNLYVLNAENGRMLMDPGVPYESRISTPAITWKDSVIFSNVAGEVFAHSKDGKSLEWQMNLPKGYATALLSSEDQLFALSSEKVLYAIDPVDQKVMWEKPVRNYGFNSLSLEQGQLLVAAGDLYSYDLLGDLNWKIETKDEKGFCRGPAILDQDGLFAATQEGTLYQYKVRETPVIVNQWQMPADVWNPIEKANNFIAISDTDKHLVLIEITPSKSLSAVQ